MVADKKRRILTSEDVRSIPQGGILDVAPGTMLTDLAREWIAERKIRLIQAEPRATKIETARVAVGSDHGGFELKEALKQYLAELPASCVDYGAYSRDSVDYPDFAHAVALAVALGHARQGIVIDGAGIGSAIVANKVPGIRAGACYGEAGVRNAREHNDINVLTLGSTMMPPEKLRTIVHIFMTAEHTEPRHRARVAKITGIEKKYYRPV